MIGLGLIDVIGDKDNTLVSGTTKAPLPDIADMSKFNELHKYAKTIHHLPSAVTTEVASSTPYTHQCIYCHAKLTYTIAISPTALDSNLFVHFESAECDKRIRLGNIDAEYLLPPFVPALDQSLIHVWHQPKQLEPVERMTARTVDVVYKYTLALAA